MCKHPRCICCLSGLLLFCAPIVLFCTGPLIYKYYNHAIGFKATRCSISTSTRGTTISSCSDYGGCNYIPCTSFQVLYDDSEGMTDSVGLNKSRSIGYLNPDEASIRENGWCYPDPPTCCNDVTSTFDCFFNPNNKQEVIERRIFTRAGAINSLFWPLLFFVTSAMFAAFYYAFYRHSVYDVIKKGNVLHLKLFMRIRKVPKYPLSKLLSLSSMCTDRSTICLKVLFNCHDYTQSELDDLLVLLCGSLSYKYFSDDTCSSCVNLLIEFGANVRYSDRNGNTALHVAASAGRHGCVVLLLQQPVDVDALNMDNHTPLMEACRNATRPKETIRALINAGCYVDVRSSEGKTALHILSVRGMNCDLLLEAGADPNVQDVDGNTPLHLAVSTGSYSCVNDLLNIQSEIAVRTHTINENVKNNKGRTPLMEAYMNLYCPSEIIQALLHAGSDVNTQDIDDKTALHHAAENKMDLMPLLKFGADPNLSDKRGNTVFHIAASRGYLLGLKALLNDGNSISANLSVNAKNIQERTPLIQACVNGYHSEDIIETLVTAGTDVNIQDIDDKTALHYAAEYELDLMPFLKHGADPNLRDYMGNTVLHKAATKGYLSGVRALLNSNEGLSSAAHTAKINVNATNFVERTPLIVACLNHRGDIIETLVNAGCDVNIQDLYGKTALHYAAGNELDLISLLKFGVDHYFRDNMGNTLLHIAASKGFLSCVTAFLNLINVNVMNIEQQTPLILACMNHKEDIIETLVNAGSDVNIRDIHGGTALFYAVERTLNASVLLARDADPFVYHSSGYTAFELAVVDCIHDTIIELVRNNSVPQKIISTRNDWNLLNIALNNHSFAIARALLIGGYDRAPLLNWIQSLSLTEIWPDGEGAGMEWMMECATNHSSVSLRHLSCLAIRRSISRRIVSSVEQLPLPRILKDYVSLKDLISCQA